jgi:hypothetical protein
MRYLVGLVCTLAVVASPLSASAQTNEEASTAEAKGAVAPPQAVRGVQPAQPEALVSPTGGLQMAPTPRQTAEELAWSDLQWLLQSEPPQVYPGPGALNPPPATGSWLRIYLGSEGLRIDSTAALQRRSRRIGIALGITIPIVLTGAILGGVAASISSD